MPDLNLIEEGDFEESPEVSTPPPAKKKPLKPRGGGAGGGRTVLILLLIIAILGGGGYYLYQKGKLKLPIPFKKKKPVVEFKYDDFDKEFPAQVPAEQRPSVDTTEGKETAAKDTSLALIETPPIEENENKKESEDSAATTSGVKLSDMKGEFTIQVIAYSSKGPAVEASKNLNEAGYPAFVEKIPMKGGEWYTVRIGKYATREEAEKAVQEFPDELKEHYVIDRIRSKEVQ